MISGDRSAAVVAQCLLLLCASIGVAATASGQVVSVYEATSKEGAPFSRVLVVGAHESTDIRRRFEDSVVDALGSKRTQAFSSFAVMGRGQAIDAETLVAAAAEVEADAVLVTRLLDVQYSAELDEGRSSATATRRDDHTLVDFFRYDYVEIPDPVTLTMVGTVVVASDLYRVADRAKLWSVESTAFEKKDASDVIDSISKALRRELRRDDMVR